MTYIKIATANKEYCCELCNFNTSKKNDYNKHLLTQKHIYANKKYVPKITTKMFQCECGKEYKHRQSLHNHKKLCNQITEHYQEEYEEDESEYEYKKVNIENKNTTNIREQNEDDKITKDMILELIKQNKDLQNVLIEQNNKIIELARTPSVINNTTNNQQFNLQIFLNETCKDAVNIMDFVNSLQLKVEDFEATGRLGYVEGISRIIVNGLKCMDVDKRPMHCTDFKRETLYIKDKNTWSKENPDKNKFKKVVNQVARLNLNQLPKWQEQNPDSVNINTPENDEFVKLSLAALGSRTPEEEEKYVDKIMKNVLKEVIIDKK